jgi:hypothetical protein
MKTQLITLATLAALASAPALADGFVCNLPDEGNIMIRVYNETHPEDGTRNVAAFVLANPSLKRGERTLARFLSAQEPVESSGASYYVDLSPRVKRLRGDKRLLGTYLKNIDRLTLDVAFNYNQPVAAGTVVDALLEIQKSNGDVQWVDMICERYLKGDSEG